MTPKQLFDAGRVRDAETELTAYLRDHPTDVGQRTFLFELLCFSGDYDRAEKQLSVLAQGGAQAEMGAVLYYACLLYTSDAADEEGNEFPSGQRVWLLDDEEVPFLEIRSLEFAVKQAAGQAATN